ncbi:hypothetical protein KI387_006981, partial [Taxus chinensis]
NRLQWAPFSFRGVRNRSSASQRCGMSLYDVLSVPESAELAQLKKAYRKKVKSYHPDVCPSDEKEESCKKFLLVQEAYETLCDPMLRADYDYNLNFSIDSKITRNVRRGKQKWEEQLQNLKKNSKRARMRCNRETAHAH